MTCRRNLVWGLFVALSLSPCAALRAQAANQSATSESSITLLTGHVPDISLRQSVIPASGVASTWQRSTQDRIQESSGDIRFNKPVIVAANKPTSAPINKPIIAPAAKRILPAAAPRQAKRQADVDSAQRWSAPQAGSVPQVALQARVVPTVIASDQDSSAPGTRTITFAPPSTADEKQAAQVAAAFQARPMVTQALASAQPQRLSEPTSVQPIVTKPQSEAAVSTPNAQQSTNLGVRPETRLTDEQLQLVSQILTDNQVKQATQDEALPPSPAGAHTNSPDKSGESTSGLELTDSAVCVDGCCPPPPRLFWTAGVEATFLNPDLNSDGVSFEVEELNDTPARYDLCTTSSDDIDSFYVSPRIWLGVQGCAWGANLRYWHLQAAEGSFDPSIGGLGNWTDYDCGRPDLGFSSCSNLEAYTVDLELTRRFCLHDCAMQGSVGMRHADVEHNEGLFGLANTDEGLLTGFARANRVSRGTGILLGLYGRKPIYPCSCVHWFYNARWSALWGPTQTSVETFASVLTNSSGSPSGAAASVNGAYTNVDDTMFIGEIQLGLEWDYALQCIPAKAFFRAAIEYQRWDGGMGFSQSQSFAGATIVGGSEATSILTANASAAEPQMDLIGISLGTGLTW